MRTREQIIADCERRFAELQAEAAKPTRQYPCKSCQWYREVDHDGYHWSSKQRREQHATCHEPLVKGFERFGVRVSQQPRPCGPEKALWQPKPSRIKRAKEWWDADTGGWPTLIALVALGAFFWAAVQ